MSINTTFWLAIDEDGEEAVFEEQPQSRIDNKLGFFYCRHGMGFVPLPTGQIKAWGYNLKPGECMEVTGPNYDSKDEWYEQ